MTHEPSKIKPIYSEIYRMTYVQKNALAIFSPPRHLRLGYTTAPLNIKENFPQDISN
ncbi:hypothetical protein ADIS_0504 [Lunatimonas lonarensis]|uniref:Uncharacterized protein n=1 Tax=Lunatimonas lonarensis TaxID=1232681 RepID=R7ZXM7_9BACT|nr:hypothetical protein ADIS_0504 [Lunatimonas lonarensis]